MKPREGIYKPKYRDKKSGELKESAVWWIRYRHHGEQYRENSESEKHSDALALLHLRRGQAGMGRPVTAAVRRTTLAKLRDLVLQDYDHNEYDTKRRQQEAFAHLIDFFSVDC